MLTQNRLQFFHARMNRRRLFERQIRRCRFALGGELAQQRVSAGIKVVLHAGDLHGVLLIGAALKTWGQAHFHLGINTAGKRRIGMQIGDAAPHLEKVERIVHELLGGHARNKRPIVNRLSVEPAEPRCDGCSRIRIVQMQLHERRETETHTICISLRKRRPKNRIQQEPRLEIGSSGRELDRANTVSEIQLLRPLFDWPEQSLQAPS